MKIQIIGYSGSGKSTLAKTLSLHYNLNVLYLDNVQFYGDWQQRSNEEQTRIVKEFIDLNPEGWVIDGNYTKIVPERFEICDVIIFLDYNRWYCYQKCRQRLIKHKVRARESCPCVDRFDWEFRKWILFSGRTKKQKEKHLRNFNKCQGERLRFNHVKELNKYLLEKQIITKM